MGTRPGSLVEVERARAPLPTRDTGGWRLRVATLWIVFAVSMIAEIVLFLLEPGAIKDVMAGEAEGETITETMTLMLAAIFIVVPLAMAFLTLVLPDTAGRWTSGVVAAFLSVMNGIDLVGHLGDGKFGGEVLMMLATVVAGLMIVWYAWRSRSEVRRA